MFCGICVPISQIEDLFERREKMIVINRLCLCNLLCENLSGLLYLQTILFTFLVQVLVYIGSLHFNR